MIEQKYGKIINTSSVSAERGNFGQTNYTATKAALIGMTKTWAKEFGRKGINVNAVAPGFVETGMTACYGEDVRREIAAEAALCRNGTPRDIAEPVFFLASEKASFITGQVLVADGGR